MGPMEFGYANCIMAKVIWWKQLWKINCYIGNPKNTKWKMQHDKWNMIKAMWQMQSYKNNLILLYLKPIFIQEKCLQWIGKWILQTNSHLVLQ